MCLNFLFNIQVCVCVEISLLPGWCHLFCVEIIWTMMFEATKEILVTPVMYTPGIVFTFL